MVTDEMLRDAALEAENYLASELSASEVQAHGFSEDFEKKISKLTVRAGHPVGYRIFRSAAVVFFAILTLCGVILGLRSEARADMMGWFRKEQYGTVQYSGGEAEVQEKYDYYLAYIPDGCRKLDTIEQSSGKIYCYVDPEDYMLTFSYSYSFPGTALFLNGVGDYARYSGSVNGLPAEIYISPRDDETSAIVWQDPEQKVLFCICARVDRATLIQLAESVQKK